MKAMVKPQPTNASPSRRSSPERRHMRSWLPNDGAATVSAVPAPCPAEAVTRPDCRVTTRASGVSTTRNTTPTPPSTVRQVSHCPSQVHSGTSRMKPTAPPLVISA
ncbi:hypothetical protein GCM10020295_15790 [Streptomyces cinereospinus]